MTLASLPSGRNAERPRADEGLTGANVEKFRGWSGPRSGGARQRLIDLDVPPEHFSHEFGQTDATLFGFP